MNSKQECIAKAYGNYDFGQDKNGWSSLDHVSEETDLSLFDAKNGMDNDTGIGFVLVRPKSLQGIENNNGWIKIESEDDLPKDYNSLYDVSNNQNVDSVPMTLHQVKYLYNNNKITHYQKHEKKIPPLY